MNETRLNEIWAVFFLAVSVFLFVSLISFDSNDLALYSSNPNSPVKNVAGSIGAYIAGILVFLVGKAGFIVPLLGLVWAIGRITGKPPQHFYIKFLGSTILILTTSALFSVLAGRDQTVRFFKGGIAGLGFSDFLTRYFGTWGTYIILATLFLLSTLLATDFLLFPLLQAAANKISRFPSALGRPSAEVRAKVETAAKPARAALPLAKRTTPESPRSVISKRETGIKPVMIDKPKPAAKPEIGAEPAHLLKTKSSEYKLPPLGLLDSPPPVEERKIKDDLAVNSKILEETLADFELEVKVVKIKQGPVITRYELEPAPGIKISRIASLSDDIALAMKALSVRVVAPIPGKGTVGVEVPNSEGTFVYLKEIIGSKEFQEADSKLAIALGKNISGEPVVADLGDMPHLLIAGTTGSGKTVCVNSLIASLLFRYNPDELKFIMIDPKMVELAAFNGLPHLLCPVVTDAKKVSGALNWVVNEMERRYELFAQSGSRNIDIYNGKMQEDPSKRLPYIIVIIDELADLMAVAQGDIENAITRLAQLSRAVGIHIILATQRPSVDVITGVIKANFPARISFKVASKVDSRTVLDMNGADKLLGTGDMLFMEPGISKPIRAQGSLVSDGEITRIVDFIKAQRASEYNNEILAEQRKTGFKQFEKDEVYAEAVRLVLQTRQASVSMLQRRLGLGYTRAARIIDMMEDEGIVGPYMGSKPRDILVDKIEDIGSKERVESSHEQKG